MGQKVTPYYETDLGKLYHGDCKNVLPGLERADLIITSPPYDELRDYGGLEFDFFSVADAICDNLTAGGLLVWVVGDSVVDKSESLTSFKHALYFKEKCNLFVHDTMIYMKNGPAYPSKLRYYQIFEYMFVFSNACTKTFNPIKDRENKCYGQKWRKKR